MSEPKGREHEVAAQIIDLLAPLATVGLMGRCMLLVSRSCHDKAARLRQVLDGDRAKADTKTHPVEFAIAGKLVETLEAMGGITLLQVMGALEIVHTAAKLARDKEAGQTVAPSSVAPKGIIH